jgi:hypothetical protein
VGAAILIVHQPHHRPAVEAFPCHLYSAFLICLMFHSNLKLLMAREAKDDAIKARQMTK